MVVVGPHDGVDDLVIVEGLGTLDLRHETDKSPVAHHLSLEPGGAVCVPDRFTPVRERHADAELIHTGPSHLCVDATLTKRVDHLSSPVLVHRHPSVTRRTRHAGHGWAELVQVAAVAPNAASALGPTAAAHAPEIPSERLVRIELPVVEPLVARAVAREDRVRV
jgi:hypothetical protein